MNPVDHCLRFDGPKCAIKHQYCLERHNFRVLSCLFALDFDRSLGFDEHFGFCPQIIPFCCFSLSLISQRPAFVSIPSRIDRSDFFRFDPSLSSASSLSLSFLGFISLSLPDESDLKSAREGGGIPRAQVSLFLLFLRLGHSLSSSSPTLNVSFCPQKFVILVFYGNLLIFGILGDFGLYPSGSSPFVSLPHPSDSPWSIRPNSATTQSLCSFWIFFLYFPNLNGI